MQKLVALQIHHSKHTNIAQAVHENHIVGGEHKA